jgi:hypothetical protein
MTRLNSVAIAGTCVLAVVLLVSPSVQAMALDAIGSLAESTVKGLFQPFWPFAHGKCSTLGRFDPACPQCL